MGIKKECDEWSLGSPRIKHLIKYLIKEETNRLVMAEQEDEVDSIPQKDVDLISGDLDLLESLL